MSAGAHDDRLVRHGMLLMVSSQVANVANVLFHAVMGRGLTPDQYGILATMLNLMLVLVTPLDALRNAMAHFSARAHRAGEPEVVRALVRTWAVRVAVIAVPASLAGLLFHGAVARFFHLPSAVPVVMVALLLPAFLYLPVLCGALQGVQAFVWLGLTMHGWGVVRLVLGALLIWAWSATATAALAAHAAGAVFAVAVGLWGVAAVTRGAHAGGQATRGMGAYFVNSLIMLAGFGVLMNSDVMLVRHFHPEQAGHFSWAATIGRSVVFLPMPIAMAMFPKVISTGGTTRASRLMLLRALAMVGGLIALGVAATWALPWLPLRILYKVTDPTQEQIHLVRLVILAMSPLGLTYLLLSFEMAQHRFRTIPWLLGLAVAYIGGVALWHGSVDRILAVLGTVSVLSALIYVVALLSAPASGAPASRAA